MLKCRGLIIKQKNYGDYDRILTVLTHEAGTVSVFAKGVRSYKKPEGAMAQIFCYCEFILYEGKEFYRLNSITLLENFFALHKDIKKLALGMYLCDIAREVCMPRSDCGDFLRLVLNCLHFLPYRDAEMLKLVFECQALKTAGIAPEVFICVNCGADFGGDIFFSAANDGVMCGRCARGDSVELSAVQYAALARLFGELKGAFAVGLTAEDLFTLSGIIENYLCRAIGKTSRALDYYNGL